MAKKPQDPTPADGQQQPAPVDNSRVGKTPEERRDLVNADIAADHEGKPRPQ